MGKNKSGGFVHNHTYNPMAHGSDERRSILRDNLETKRLTVLVEKQKRHLQFFLPFQAISQKGQFHEYGKAIMFLIIYIVIS